MHQTKKGNQWYFGMKAHVGVDSKTKLIHTAVADASQRGRCGDVAGLAAWRRDARCGATGVSRAERGDSRVRATSAGLSPSGAIAIRARSWMKWSGRRTGRSLRCARRVEHVFGVMKLKFGFVKVRYRGLKKNANRLFATCALVNLFVSRRKLLAVA